MTHTLPPEDWARVERLFAAAMERPAEERAAWLREQAAEGEWLLGEVASLVQFAETEASAPLQDIVDQAAREAGSLGTSALGKSLGPYRLEAELGRGGMGVVCWTPSATRSHLGAPCRFTLQATLSPESPS
jgi:hypothetical protein